MMMKKRTFKYVAVLLAVFLVVGMTTAYATNSELNDVNDKIDNVEDDLEEGKKVESQLAGEISSLQKSINSTQNDISGIKARISRTEKDIAKTERNLKEQKEELNERSEGLNARLRNMYKNGTVGFIDVLLSSGNISEFIDNIGMLQKIYEGDRDVVLTLEKEYTVLQDKMVRLAELKKVLRQEEGKLTEKQSSLTADKSAIAGKKAQISAENRELEAKLDELNAEADRLTGQIVGLQSQGTSYSGGVLGWPVPSSHRITSEFGYRIHPILGYSKLHTGLDIGCSYGASIVAASGGTVIMAYYNGSYGNVVMIDHGGGICTLYAHNSSLVVSNGQKVSRGQTVARAGSTGASTGVHCHFEVRVNGQYKNPRNYL